MLVRLFYWKQINTNMKKAGKILCFVLILFSFVSCEIGGSTVESYTFTVGANNWIWNPTYGRYEALYDFPELTEDVYINGAVVGTVFVYDGYVETQASLPYSQTYTSTTGTYVETISFDTSLGRIPSICFYVQTSDKQFAYLKNRDFKITLISRW